MDTCFGADGEHCVIEYMYRDAANYKAHGCALVVGAFSPELESRIRTGLIDGCYFVAEDAGLPALQGQLASHSGGVTADDHDWHEFLSIRAADPEEVVSLRVAGTLEAFLAGIPRHGAMCR